MCGRYARFTPAEVYARLFDAEGDPGLEASYNVAPSQAVLAARASAQGHRELVALHWGLIPAWAADPSFGYRTINARAETVAVKPAFRSAYRTRRCLIAADGFYEWRMVGGTKRPYFIRLTQGRPFALAGLWERWTDGQAQIESCTIVVTAANEALSPIHDRMPVILEPTDYGTWLDPALTDINRVQPLLRALPGDAFHAFPVGNAVSNPRNDGPALIVPVDPAPRQ